MVRLFPAQVLRYNQTNLRSHKHRRVSKRGLNTTAFCPTVIKAQIVF